MKHLTLKSIKISGDYQPLKRGAAARDFGAKVVGVFWDAYGVVAYEEEFSLEPEELRQLLLLENTIRTRMMREHAFFSSRVVAEFYTPREESAFGRAVEEYNRRASEDARQGGVLDEAAQYGALGAGAVLRGPIRVGRLEEWNPTVAEYLGREPEGPPVKPAEAVELGTAFGEHPADSALTHTAGIGGRPAYICLGSRCRAYGDDLGVMRRHAEGCAAALALLTPKVEWGKHHLDTAFTSQGWQEDGISRSTFLCRGKDCKFKYADLTTMRRHVEECEAALVFVTIPLKKG